MLWVVKIFLDGQLSEDDCAEEQGHHQYQLVDVEVVQEVPHLQSHPFEERKLNATLQDDLIVPDLKVWLVKFVASSDDHPVDHEMHW